MALADFQDRPEKPHEGSTGLGAICAAGSAGLWRWLWVDWFKGKCTGNPIFHGKNHEEMPNGGMKSTVLQRWFLGYFLGIRRFHMIFKGVSKWDRHKLVNDWRGSGHLDHSVVTGSRYWTATTTLHPRHVGLSENAGNPPNIYIYIYILYYIYIHVFHPLLSQNCPYHNCHLGGYADIPEAALPATLFATGSGTALSPSFRTWSSGRVPQPPRI